MKKGKYYKSLFRSAVAAALLLGGSGTNEVSAQDYSNFFIFGGSYSDAGAYLVNPGTGYEQRRWTVNPALVWNQHLGATFGFNITSNITINSDTFAVTFLGGTNYAQGGSRVNFLPGEFPANNRSLQLQVDAYLTSVGGVADPNALYSLEGGGNDIFFQARELAAFKITLAEARANIQKAANDFVSIIGQMTHAGANYLLVLNIHDIGMTPIGTSFGALAQAFFENQPAAFNATLENGIRALNVSNVIYIDTFTFLNELIANPGTYGFTNSTDPSCSVSESLDCTTSTILPGASASTYLFSDKIHPTGPGHLALSQYIGSILMAPHQVALTAEAPVYAARSIYRTLDTRTWLERRSSQGFSAYVNGDFSNFEIDGTTTRPGVKNNINSLQAGFDFGFDEGLIAGLLFGHTDGSYDFSSNYGNFDMKMFTVTGYVGVQRGNGFAQFSGTWGDIDYGTIARQFDVNLGQRLNWGMTNGNYYGTRMLVGFDIEANGLTVTPIAAMTYQKVKVDGYTEGQGDSSSMTFGSQERNLIFGTIGARVSTTSKIGNINIRPQAKVTFNYDFQDQSRVIMSGLANPGDILFEMPISGPERSWWNLNAGTSVDLGKRITANLTIGGQLGQSGVTNYWANVGLGVLF